MKTLLVSGVKGGTGKTTVSTGIAHLLASAGKKTVVIDCDLEGPNCHRVFGAMDVHVDAKEYLEPVKISDNLYLFSIYNHPCIVGSKNPVVMLGETHRAFIKETVIAAKELHPDYIVLDFPAEHGDALHTLKTYIKKIDYAFVVTVPSRISTDNVENALKAMTELDIKILGIIKNMAYFKCECGRVHYIFGKNNVEEISEKYNVPIIGEIPISCTIPELTDNGKVYTGDVIKNAVDIVLGQSFSSRLKNKIRRAILGNKGEIR